MGEYLLELRSDEIPWRRLRDVARRLGSRLFEDLMSRGVGPQEVISGFTPRRIVFCHRGLPEHEPDHEKRDLGPPVAEGRGEDGEPTEALLGFAVRLGVEVEDLVTVRTERGEYFAHVRQVPGRPLAELLAERVPILLGEMRWGSATPRWPGTPEDAEHWIRPLRGILSLLDGELVPVEFAGVAASRETVAHAFTAPEPVEIRDFDDYLARLDAVGVVVRHGVRSSLLEERLEARAAELGGRLVRAPDLLRRSGLEVEIPGVIDGAYDPSSIPLPREILLAALEQEPGAFAVQAEDGEILPFFLAVVDRGGDPAGRIRLGHERAVAGRLADTRFQVERDRRLALAERSRRLDQLSFHPRLGHYGAKHQRIRALVDLIGTELEWRDALPAALQACELLKADLTTAMVRVDGGLRGKIGGIYAREEGYVKAVWQAIYDQYKPGSLEESIPRGEAGRLVAVADTLDTLVGAFGLGEAPTGSKDPRGLRRRAQGLLRTLIEGRMALDLDLVAARAVLLYGDLIEQGAADLLGELQSFLNERLHQLLGKRGFAVDEIEAVMAVGSRSNLPDLEARLRALRAVREDAEFRSLVLTAKRIYNIVHGAPEHELRAELLIEDAEKDLYAAYLETRREVEELADGERYEECLRAMMRLVKPLDRFFAEVLVMDEDRARRESRVALLQAVRRMFWRLARLKEMTVEKDPPSLDDTITLLPSMAPSKEENS